MGSELGPEHDHNMDPTSLMQRHLFTFLSLFLIPEFFAVAVADVGIFFETSLESPAQKFEEGLPRCFQFWYMLEVCIPGRTIASDYFFRVTTAQFSRWMWRSRWEVPGTLYGGNLTLMWRRGSRAR